MGKNYVITIIILIGIGLFVGSSFLLANMGVGIIEPKYNTSQLEERMWQRHLKTVGADRDVVLLAEKSVRKNIKTDVEQLMGVVANLEKIHVQKTQDTDTYVITLVAMSGVRAGLWLYSDGTLDGISPY